MNAHSQVVERFHCGIVRSFRDLCLLPEQLMRNLSFVQRRDLNSDGDVNYVEQLETQDCIQYAYKQSKIVTSE